MIFSDRRLAELSLFIDRAALKVKTANIHQVSCMREVSRFCTQTVLVWNKSLLRTGKL